MDINKDLILIPYRIFSNGTKVDWTNELQPYRYRTLWEIIWSCALTVFACTWVTIHPNIPSRWSWFSKKCYKVQLWIVDLIMPELLLIWAAKQYNAACDLTQRQKGEGTNPNWTKIQAFFALMGGCEGKPGGGREVVILSPYDFNNRASMIMPTDEEISDKSKGDSFVKALALVQTLWFAVNTIYRVQSWVLYATEAEIVTLTFAWLSTITNLYWWSKPKNIEVPLPTYPTPTPSPNPTDNPTDDPNPAPSPNPTDVLPSTYFKFKSAISELWSRSISVLRSLRPGISKSDIYAYIFFKLAAEMLQSSLRLGNVESGRRPGNAESGLGNVGSGPGLTISKSEVYAYDGALPHKMTTLAFLSFVAVPYGLAHLTIASLNGGLAHARGRIWFSCALLGSALSFYLLLATLICIVLDLLSKKWGEKFRYYVLNKYVGWAFLLISAIGRIGLIGVLVYFMFSPYDYHAFLTPKWSYIPHPF